MKLNTGALVGVNTEYATGRKFIHKAPAKKKATTASAKLYLGMGDTARKLYDVLQTPEGKAYYLYLLSEDKVAPEVRQAGIDMSKEIDKGTRDKRHGRQVGHLLTGLYGAVLTREIVQLMLADMLMDGEHREVMLLLVKATMQRTGMVLRDFVGMMPLQDRDKKYLTDNRHYLAEDQ